MPLLTLSGVAGYFVLGQAEFMLLAPRVLLYGIVPLLDTILGSDEPSEELVPQLEADRCYRILTWLTVPVHFVVLLVLAGFVGTQPLSAWAIVAVALTTCIYSGLGINTARELGHKKSAFQRALARIALAVSTYGHFCVEHNRGHHRDVATPEDPAKRDQIVARYGAGGGFPWLNINAAAAAISLMKQLATSTRAIRPWLSRTFQMTSSARNAAFVTRRISR